MAGEASGDSFVLKFLGGASATVIAPILVAIGLKFTDKVVPTADAPASATAVSAQGQSTASPLASSENAARTSSPLRSEANRAPRPGTTIRLFNGQSLQGFYKYLGPTHRGAEPLGKNHDPQHVISVREGLIHFSGQVEGGLATNDEYENYRLTVVYKWGDRTWIPREDAARKSGVLLHCTGQDGEVRGRWMRSVKCEIHEGNTGTLHLLGATSDHPLHLTAEADLLASGGSQEHSSTRYQYSPGAPFTTFTRGELLRLGRSPRRMDVKGFHETGDIEKPLGEWNTLECTCLDDKITIRLNGRLVNEARTADMRGNSTLTKGKIMLQSEKAEIFFREILLQPLTPAAAGKGA